MPKYQVELQNGKKYVVEADSMPTKDEVATELQKNPDYMKGLSTPSDIFHKSAGENVIGVVRGAGQRAGEIAKSLPLTIMDPLGTEQARISGKGEQDPLKAFGNAVTSAAKYAVTEPVRIGQQLGEGTPEAAGKSLVDTAMYIPGILGVGRVASTGVRELAQTAPVRAARSGVADVMRRASENSPELNEAAGATGMRGKLGMTQKILGVVAKKVDPGPLRSVDRYMSNTPASSHKAVPDVKHPLSLEAATQAAVDRYMPNKAATGTYLQHAEVETLPMSPDAEILSMLNRYMPNTSAGPTMTMPNADVIPSQEVLVRQQIERHMPNTSAGPSRSLPNAEVIPSEDARVQAMLDRYMPNVSADLPIPAPTPFASHLSASGADTNFGRTPGAGNAVYRQEGLPSELEQQMMDQERARAGENRGLTTAATERAMNVHTPGWHDVSLEEPAAVSSHKRPSEVSPVETIARSLPNTPSASAKAMAARLRELELNPIARSVYPELEQEYQGLLRSMGRYAKTGGLTSAGTGNWRRPTPTGRK